MSERSKASLVGVIVLGATVLSACTGPEEVPTPSQPEASAETSRTHNIVSCMSNAGWAVEVDEFDGSLQVPSVPDSQIVNFEQTLEECISKFPLPEIVISSENAERYYDALVAAGLCLEELGLTVPEPPSKAASVESMIGGNGIIDPLWDPHEPLFIGEMDRVETAKAMVACPRPEWGAP